MTHELKSSMSSESESTIDRKTTNWSDGPAV